MLGLIQLWADTFMMQEETYPAYMRAYRELRTDGVKFPPRDPNERFMIKFEGEPSPAFELADMEQPGKVENDSRRPQVQEDQHKLLESDVVSLKQSFQELENFEGASNLEVSDV